MTTAATRSRWVLDPAHTLVEFSVKHMMIATVKGRFTGVSGHIDAALPDLTTATIEVTVEAASVSTADDQRDQHLRSADFLEVDKYPQLTFRNRQIERTGDDEYRLTGELTIHGVTREVEFSATFEGQGKDPWGNERAGFSAETRVNRKDFGLHWNAVLETGGILVGDQVRISIQIEAIRQA